MFFVLFFVSGIVVLQVSEKDQSVVLTDKGYDDCDRILGKSIFDPRDPWAPYVINSIKAKELFTKDKVWCGVVLVWRGGKWCGVVWCAHTWRETTRSFAMTAPCFASFLSRASLRLG